MEADITNIIENYVDDHTDDVSVLLEELMAETENITGRSFWSIGKVEGKLLQLIIKMSKTKRAIEVGTFTGYSALVIAEALPEDGILKTCENSREYADIALRYFNKSPYGQKIHLKLGPALQTLRNIKANSEDFFFIDADILHPAHVQEHRQLCRHRRGPGGQVWQDHVHPRFGHAQLVRVGHALDPGAD